MIETKSMIATQATITERANNPIFSMPWTNCSTTLYSSRRSFCVADGTVNHIVNKEGEHVKIRSFLNVSQESNRASDDFLGQPLADYGFVERAMWLLLLSECPFRAAGTTPPHGSACTLPARDHETFRKTVLVDRFTKHKQAER